MNRVMRVAGILVLTLLVLSVGIDAYAQLPEVQDTRYDGMPKFYYKALTRAGEDPETTLLQIAIHIANDELQFVQVKDVFQAGYEVSVSIFDEKGNQVDGKIEKKEVITKNYQETNSQSSFSLVETHIPLKPGEYELMISIMDLDSKRIVNRKSKINIIDYTEYPLDMSDIFLANDVSIDSTGKLVYLPNILGNYGEHQEYIYLWFEIYNRQGLDSVLILSRILNFKGEELRKNEHYKILDGNVTVDVMSIPRGTLVSGKYSLEVGLGEDDLIVEKAIDFTVNWIGMSGVASDLNKAIDQLKYIAKSGQIKKIKKFKGSEREEGFREFWQSRDPTPGTEKNEIMEEYYRRVAFSNATFGKYAEGWKTDRGMIYIILGPPDDIERYPFAPDSKPYEIWYYTRVKYYPLIFVDKSGFGEYRLTSESWEIFYQLR